MYQAFTGGLGGIALAKHGKSRAINAENPHGEKGRGGMAASHLGPSRKGSPCLRDIEPGTVVTLWQKWKDRDRSIISGSPLITRLQRQIALY